jgi:hypothetical protein
MKSPNCALICLHIFPAALAPFLQVFQEIVVNSLTEKSDAHCRWKPSSSCLICSMLHLNALKRPS